MHPHPKPPSIEPFTYTCEKEKPASPPRQRPKRRIFPRIRAPLSLDSLLLQQTSIARAFSSDSTSRARCPVVLTSLYYSSSSAYSVWQGHTSYLHTKGGRKRSKSFVERVMPTCGVRNTRASGVFARIFLESVTHARGTGSLIGKFRLVQCQRRALLRFRAVLFSPPLGCIHA